MNSPLIFIMDFEFTPLSDTFPPLTDTDHVRATHESIIDFWKTVSRDCELYSARKQLVSILNTIRSRINTSAHSIDHAIYLSILENMFCFIAHTRDIHCGLGRRETTYMMLDAWYECFPVLACFALRELLSGDNSQYGYGSWRDVSGLYDYMVQYSVRGADHPLVDNAVELMNTALRKDWMTFTKYGYSNTNVAKWVPRETSSHKELFNKLAYQWTCKYTPHILQSPTSIKAEFAAARKYKTMYRKIIVALTELIDPVERHMCSKEARMITPAKIPHGSLAKNWDALFNQTSDLTVRYDNDLSRIACASDVQQFLNMPLSVPYTNPSGYSRIENVFSFPNHLDKYVLYAIRCIEHITDYSNFIPKQSRLGENINMLNRQWEHISYKWNSTIRANDVPVIFIDAASIHSKHVCRAIAHACLIAQKSGLKRILYATHSPIWINLEICDGFVAMVRAVYNALNNESLTCTDLESALQCLGQDHPFSPIIVTQNGYCYRHSAESDFYQFFEIMDSDRYESMKTVFGRAVDPAV